MNHRIFAALLFAGLAFTAGPALAQGYAGVLPSDQKEGPDLTGALPFMSSQLSPQDHGGEKENSGKPDSSNGQAIGGYEVNGEGLSDDDMTAKAEEEEGRDPGDMTDIYGLHGNSNTGSGSDQSDDQASNVQAGFLAAFAGANGKAKDELDPINDPVPENMYRSMEGDKGDPNEQRRVRVQRAVKAAEAQRMKEIENMNAERMRDHQVQAQGEIDRIMVKQNEEMAKLREKQGLPPEEETQETSGDEDDSNNSNGTE